MLVHCILATSVALANALLVPSANLAIRDTANSKSDANNGQSMTQNGQCLAPGVVQTASQRTGVDSCGSTFTPSATDNANFINFCRGQTLTNGLQIAEGSCNGIVMGKIPSAANMVSTIIRSPKPGDKIAPLVDFNVVFTVTNLQLGFASNLTSAYYSAPQDLLDGKIVGHCHLAIQDLGGSLYPDKPLDPTKFAFFGPVDEKGENGTVTFKIPGGLPKGNYRVCVSTVSTNHMPVLMPVARRGAQDDCQRFVVG